MYELCKDICEQMSPIGLSEMKGIRLMNRLDTKYLFPTSELPKLLMDLKHGFRVQVVEGKCISPYSTLYYDTDDLQMYIRHHDQHRVRQKIRTRAYMDSNLCFIEVKRKNNKGRTSKKRTEIPMNCMMNVLECDEAVAFMELHSDYGRNDVQPTLQTQFDRITLVNELRTERLTIDLNLSFTNIQTGNQRQLPELAIIELKQDGKQRSLVQEHLSDFRIRPGGISKYCLGTVLTNEWVKKNQFKKKIRYIQKLTSTHHDFT